MKKKWWIIIAAAVVGLVAVACLLAYAINWAFFDIQRIDGQQQLSQSTSPDGSYTVTAYLNNGGATTDYAVLCSVKNNDTGEERNIYWNYHCDSAHIAWLDDTTVTINGVVLDVENDTYDWRLE